MARVPMTTCHTHSSSVSTPFGVPPTAKSEKRVLPSLYNLRCRLGPASLSRNVNSSQELVGGSTRNVLGEEVRWVFCAQHLAQGDLTGSDFLLHPKLAYCQMPDAANATASAYTDGCRGVCIDSQLHFGAKILGETLQAQRLCRAFHDASKLRLPGAQSHDFLGRAPMLD